MSLKELLQEEIERQRMIENIQGYYQLDCKWQAEKLLNIMDLAAEFFTEEEDNG